MFNCITMKIIEIVSLKTSSKIDELIKEFNEKTSLLKKL